MNRTIVMIHGMMAGPWCWDNYRQFFTGKNYTCIAPSLKLHDMDPGEPPPPLLGTTSLGDYVDDLIEKISDLGKPPILMGHSMGGLLAQLLASRGYAKAAILLTPAPPGGINTLRYSVLKSFSGAMMHWGFWRKPFRFSFKRAVYSTMHLMPYEDQIKVYKRLVYESGHAAFQIGFWFLDRTKASRVNYAKVTCPVLIISGKWDRITPATVVKRTADKYKSATYKQFDDHAHWVLSEPGWEDVVEYIGMWLQKNSL